MSFKIQGPCFGASGLCTPILRLLPGWFGIPAAVQHYSQEIASLPTFLARQDEEVLGFLSLKQHNPYAAEVYVMGVHPQAHRQGIGRALVEQASFYLRTQKVEYLQVKTLGPSNPDEGYARTRAFYLAMGFRPLEELRTLWDENNPCLLMVLALG